MTRRIVAALVLLLMLYATAAAETHYKPHIWLGGRGGMTLSKISFSPSVRQGWNQGATGAVTFRYSEEKLFGLVAELGWTQRGWKEQYDPEVTAFSYRRTITYVNLPLLTHIYFGGPRFKCFFNLGAEVGMYLGDKIYSNFDYRNMPSVAGYPPERHTEQLGMDITGKFDYGICVGFGTEFYVQPRHSVSLECRFYYGLGNIYPSSKADIFGASRNMTLSLTAGYNFRLR